MSKQMAPDEALEMIPALAGTKWRWQAMPGGLTNRNYKVEAADHCFVLRLDDEHTANFGLDRDTELKARNAACAASLAARVVFADNARSILLTEFLTGDVWQAADLNETHNLVSLAELIREVHALPSLGVRFDAGRVVQHYAGNLIDSPDLRAFAGRCQQVALQTPIADRYCCCHNDIIAENIVAQDRLMLLDWEYACDNDPMFDLASVIGFHDLGAKQTEILFNAYAGGADSALREQLDTQIHLFDAVQWLWFAARHSISPDARLAERMKKLQKRIKGTVYLTNDT
jgi:thiamine kinase